jgi:hypothetical protein
VLCEKGAVKKKLVFSSTTIAGGKQAFNIDTSSLITQPVWTALHCLGY